MGEKNLNVATFYSGLIATLLGVIIYLLLSEDPTSADKAGTGVAAFFLAIFGVIFIVGVIRILVPSFGKKKLIVEKLRTWGLLSSVRDYNYFKEIQAIPFYQKLEQYGEEFIEDYIKIMHLKTLKNIRKYIESISESHRRIRIAATYFDIKNDQDTKFKSPPS